MMRAADVLTRFSPSSLAVYRNSMVSPTCDSSSGSDHRTDDSKTQFWNSPPLRFFYSPLEAEP